MYTVHCLLLAPLLRLARRRDAVVDRRTQVNSLRFSRLNSIIAIVTLMVSDWSPFATAVPGVSPLTNLIVCALPLTDSITHRGCIIHENDEFDNTTGHGKKTLHRSGWLRPSCRTAMKKKCRPPVGVTFLSCSLSTFPFCFSFCSLYIFSIIWLTSSITRGIFRETLSKARLLCTDTVACARNEWRNHHALRTTAEPLPHLSKFNTQPQSTSGEAEYLAKASSTLY